MDPQAWPHTFPASHFADNIQTGGAMEIVEDSMLPDAGERRNYQTLAHIPARPQPNSEFRGQIEPVPIFRGQPIGAGSDRVGRRTSGHRAHELEQYPPQSNATAWARMLAAARDADKIQARGRCESGATPLAMARMQALLPVARKLYHQRVYKRAKAESKLIQTLRGHCEKFVPREPYSRKRSDRHFRRGAAEPWTKKTCEKEAQKLPVPFTPRTLRPVSPNAVGINMVPTFSVWSLLRKEITKNMTDAEKRQRYAYGYQIANKVKMGALDQSAVQPLHNVKFVDEVRVRAPPLVAAFPPHWTKAQFTDELHEALQALIKLPSARPLADLVDRLSRLEYDVVVEERSCLSRVLKMRAWRGSCALARSLGDYKEFVRALRQDPNFKGSLERVPPRSIYEDSSSGGSSMLAKRPVVEDAGSGSDELLWGAGKRQRPAAGIDPLIMLADAADELEGSAAAPWGVLARSNGANAVSSVAVFPLAAAGAVAALGLVLFLVALVFRFRMRSRRVASGSRARSGHL